MNKLRFKLKVFMLGLPALAGFIVMFIYPFVKSFWYSLVDNTHRMKFVFLDNYVTVIHNSYYRLAMKNTFIFSLVGIAVLTVVSLALSVGLLKLSARLSFIKNILVAPMVLPSASMVVVWQYVFQSDAYTAFTSQAVGASFWEVLPIYLLYIWKNAGINIILITAAMVSIPLEVQEAAALDGANGLRRHWFITFPLIFPQLLFVGVLSFVNALKSFRESYLFFQTDYPPDAAYTVQYYMNNHFQKLNYPYLAAGSIMFTCFIVVILWIVYRMECRYHGGFY